MKSRPVSSVFIIGTLVAAFLSSGGTAALAASVPADFKIAFVDLQKALQSVEAGRKAKSTLEKEFNEKRKSLQTEEDSIKKMTEQFKNQAGVLSEEAKIRKQNEIQERMMKFRELFQKSQMDIQNREHELTEPIIQKLKAIVDDIGKKNGYSVILEKSENSVLYSLPKDDLTEDVIKAFNKKNG